MPHTIKDPNPLPCGCGIMGTPGINWEGTRTEHSDLFLRFCPLHSAAPGMLAACKSAIAVLSQLSIFPVDIREAKTWLSDAIKEAEGSDATSTAPRT